MPSAYANSINTIPTNGIIKSIDLSSCALLYENSNIKGIAKNKPVACPIL